MRLSSLTQAVRRPRLPDRGRLPRDLGSAAFRHIKYISVDALTLFLKSEIPSRRRWPAAFVFEACRVDYFLWVTSSVAIRENVTVCPVH